MAQIKKEDVPRTNEMILSTQDTKWSPIKLYSKFVSSLSKADKIIIKIF